jgi:trehalose 6-phosphate phosphatase
MMSRDPLDVAEHLSQADRIWLFLDYDGTLADFAPTPEHVLPDPDLVALLTRLAQDPRLRVAVVSGRRLSHVQRLVPVPGILLAGTYGIELLTPEGERIDRLDYGTIRPTLETLKPQWTDLVSGREGFFLEDKGWALALHARFSDPHECDRILAEARRMAVEASGEAAPGLFRLLGGHKFLEIGPQLAHKGRTVEYLLAQYPWPGSLPIYLGDDDKDEEAFAAIKAQGGFAIVVAPEPRDTRADLRLPSTKAARRWLSTLLQMS